MESSLVDEIGNSVKEVGEEKVIEIPRFRDIRRYYCDYCGISRSKKSILRSHILQNHQDKLEEEPGDVDEENWAGNRVRHSCQECGVSFRKPAHLKQHMQCHSPERPFSCPLEDCRSSYKRKDHLTRHLLKHQGKIFTCSVENCNRKFGIQGNMRRHVREMHEDEMHFEGAKKHVCPEAGCGKMFKYFSQLKKHEDSHAKLDCIEVVCGELGCMKTFTNTECLKDHIRSCHQHFVCTICGKKQLKKNFKRHEQSHVAGEVIDRVKCSFEDCDCTFSNMSNLNKHIKAAHQELRPFACRFSGCGKKFPYRHVRDNHEKSGFHSCVQGDFLEADEVLRSKSRGGRKRKTLSVEILQRKRVVPPEQVSTLGGTEYLRWLLDEQDRV